ncbi:MAG: cytochrome c oxidase subunit II [Anaerolineae bacterium]|nr:cytochrome c oxidase subunit II [Anaerolineae bacterium]MCO5187937.1 cytochrome c oxidase subunit II [Anaerolineae bacterium]MCO5195052.1 cytochrome c oxidase subunit II [Anaerolineae bacterium]MCO5196416.1 cytochrome c oxidase subunit II [Anaerolineae bacterium]MCO5207183.1 cytochrome c oxidase subunit II [Anaerolineae bacterium]
MNNKKHLLIVALLIIVVMPITYVILTAVYQLPIAASTQADSIDNMFTGHFILISGLFALVMVFMLYSLFVFRRRPDEEGDGLYIHGNTALEIFWTAAPLVLVVGFAIWGSVMLVDITEAKADEMAIDVTARQWSWSFAYPEQGGYSSIELVLPVNRPIVLQMRSEDVLHDFWVPEFRVKQDLVPGSIEVLRITPNVEGEYKVRCAEICGLNHSGMLADVRVVSQAEFDAWVLEKQSGPDPLSMTPEERGILWFQQFGCGGCHSVDGSDLVGPTWLGLYEREELLEDGTTVIADDDYIRNSILNPASQIVAGYANVMLQTYGEQFAVEEAKYNGQIDIIEDIIAYIKTLEE